MSCTQRPAPQLSNGLAIQICFLLLYSVGDVGLGAIDHALLKVTVGRRRRQPVPDGAKMEGNPMANREQRSNRESKKPKKAKVAAKPGAPSVTASTAKPNPPPAWKQAPPKS
jgi:hypothetical protein